MLYMHHFWMVTVVKWLRVRRQSLCLQKEHKKYYMINNSLFVKINNIWRRYRHFFLDPPTCYSVGLWGACTYNVISKHRSSLLMRHIILTITILFKLFLWQDSSVTLHVRNFIVSINHAYVWVHSIGPFKDLALRTWKPWKLNHENIKLSFHLPRIGNYHRYCLMNPPTESRVYGRDT